MTKICNILSYLEETQKLFLALRLTSIEKEKKIQLAICPHVIFWNQCGHKCRETEILNTLRLVHF